MYFGVFLNSLRFSSVARRRGDAVDKDISHVLVRVSVTGTGSNVTCCQPGLLEARQPPSRGNSLSIGLATERCQRERTSICDLRCSFQLPTSVIDQHLLCR